jgi:N-acetylglucosaminyldiphosphoundecaprenol N-acetyl-beta-D-mannosaminyltransferase
LGCQTVITVNALTLLTAFEDPGYAAALSRADVVLADGVGAVWAARRLTGRTPERTPGIELADELCAVCAREGQSVFLLGGQTGVAERAAVRLRARHPGLRVAGTRDGYWEPGEEAGVVEQVNRSGADLLLAGLGQPAQERFLDRWHGRLTARLAMGVGGSLDVFAGDVKRAPAWMRRLGLEWLYRTLVQPWRLARVRHLPRFAWRVLRARGQHTPRG